MRTIQPLKFFLIGVGLLIASTVSAIEMLQVNGTGGAISTIKKIAERFEQLHPEAQTIIKNPVMGSSGGIRALIDGKLDIAISGRALRESERTQGLSEVAYARAPFGIAVAKRNRQLRNVTLEQLAAIYSGETTRLPDGSRLRLVLRPRKDGDNAVLRAISPAIAEALEAQFQAKRGHPLARTDLDNAHLIERTPGGIGSTLLPLAQSGEYSIRMVAIEGVAPTVANLRSGRYPYHKTFHLILPANPTPLAEQFVAFLRSEEGRQILEENGNWAIP